MNNMNAMSKSRAADYQLKRERNNKIKKIFAIIAMLLTVLVTILAWIFQIRGYNVYTNGALSLMKVFFYIGLGGIVLAVIIAIFAETICDSIDMNYDSVTFFRIVNIVAGIGLLVISCITLFKGVLSYKQYLNAEEDGVIYAQISNTVKPVGIIDGATDIIIRGEYDGFTNAGIKSNQFKGNEYIKSVQFIEGNYPIGNRAFKKCFNLQSIKFINLTSEFGSNVFKDSSRITEVVLENSSLSCDSANDFANLIKDCSQKLVVIVDNSSFFGFQDEFPVVILKNASSYIPEYTLPKRLVLDESFIFNKDTVIMNDEILWNTDYLSIAVEIYIPKTITSIPDYFFGDELDTLYKGYKIFYAGTEEEWNQIAISTTGNSNYTKGRYDVIYNTSYGE